MREKRKPKTDRSWADAMASVAGEVRDQKQRALAIEQVECPPLLETLGKMHVNISYAGGNCPVQIEGHVKGKRFYFRARGAKWSLGIGGDPVSEPEWEIERPYGQWPDAGWMPLHEAYQFLIEGICEWKPKLRP